MLRRLVAVLTAGIVGFGLLPSAATAAPSTAAPSTADGALLSAAAKAEPKRFVVRAGTFNVRTARARGDKRRWLQRAPDVARDILARRPGVVALQELGPGRADGKRAKVKNGLRQTTSLTSTLRRLGGGRYKLVRSTSYTKPGSKHGTQGARILYDSSRFKLMSRCPQTTGKKNYNPACAFDLPIAAGDTRKDLRSAAVARFRHRATGRQFYVVSAHLDNRHSKSKAKEAKWNRLRVRQAQAVANRVAKFNKRGLPVIFGGDINAWQTDRGRYAPYRALAGKGFKGTTGAKTKINIAYPTVNHWKAKLKRFKSGRAPRLDVVMVKGGKGVRRYENKAQIVDGARPSDHNLVLADVVL